nr:DUF4157 domain-containing protein [Acidobacteriota bacterium]
PHAHAPDAEAAANVEASANADSLSREQLTHPANAARLAGLLGQLQQSHGNAYVQRFVADVSGREAGGSAHAEAERASPGNSQSLDAGTKTHMESAFGEDFGGVRLHTGAGAERAAGNLGARAFTRGRDIYFNKGEYNPSTRDGQELLAHELTHVIQQEGAANRQANSTGQAGDTHEQEADLSAAAVLAGQRPRVVKRGAAPAYQRQPTGQRQAQPTPTAAPAPFHWYVGDPESETPFGAGRVWVTETGISPESYSVHVTFPPQLHFEIEGASGATVRVRPDSAGNRMIVDLEVNRRQRRRPTVRITLTHGGVSFQMHFHFRRRHTRPRRSR